MTIFVFLMGRGLVLVVSVVISPMKWYYTTIVAEHRMCSGLSETTFQYHSEISSKKANHVHILPQIVYRIKILCLLFLKHPISLISACPYM